MRRRERWFNAACDSAGSLVVRYGLLGVGIILLCVVALGVAFFVIVKTVAAWLS